MKYIFIALIVAGLMSGCESKEEREEAKQALLYKQKQQALAKEALMETQRIQVKEAIAKQKAIDEANTSTLRKIGISVDDGKFIIDTNKAKDFFSKLAEGFKKTSKEMNRELKEGNLTVTKAMGIEISKETLSIDFNKTQSFFESLGEKMEAFSKEFDSLSKAIDKNSSNII